MRTSMSVVLSGFLLACSASPAAPTGALVPCEGRWGDFPPAQCGVVAARAVGVRPGGAIVVMGPRPAGFTSPPAVVGTAGDFILLALHYSSEPPFDTVATVALGAFPTIDAVTPDAQPQSTAQVQVRFTHIGRRVDTTYAGEIHFH